MWWKVRGHPAVLVSCCVMTRERVAAEMQARTPVASCCYILDQVSHKDTEDHFSSLQVCAITPVFISFYHQIMTINVTDLKLSHIYINTNCCCAFKCVFITS